MYSFCAQLFFLQQYCLDIVKEQLQENDTRQVSREGGTTSCQYPAMLSGWSVMKLGRQKTPPCYTFLLPIFIIHCIGESMFRN
jgi:hypothetical protein